MDVRPNLLVKFVELLIIVASDLAARLIVEKLARTELSTGIHCIHEALHHDNLCQIRIYLMSIRRQLAIESKLNGGCMVHLQFFVLLEVELAVDLQVTIVHNLHLVHLAELDRTFKCLPTFHVFPDSAGDINEAEALIDAVNVARIFRRGSIWSPNVVMLTGAFACESIEHFDYHEDIAAEDHVEWHLQE